MAGACVWILASRPEPTGAINPPADPVGYEPSMIRDGRTEVAMVTGVLPLEEGAREIDYVHRLPKDLNRIEREALYEYLRSAEVSPYTHWVKNDIMNALRNQAEPPPELTDVLLELFYDRDQDIVVRVYALQHLRPWYRMQNQRDPRIIMAFFDALKEVDSEVAGAALLALRYLSKDLAGINTSEIAQEAVKLMQNPDANILNRVSAMQVASMLNGKNGDASPYLDYAAPGNGVTVRAAAIAAIGASGDYSAQGVLVDYQEEGGPVAVAAAAALKKMNMK